MFSFVCNQGNFKKKIKGKKMIEIKKKSISLPDNL